MRQSLIVLLAALFLSSCSLTKPIKAPPVKTYRLSAVSQVRARKTNKTILVAMPTAAPGFQSSQMVYMTSPYQMNAYAKNAWVGPPADMLQPLITQSLSNSGSFKAVAATPFVGATDLRLETQVLNLEQEFHKGYVKVRMQISATLVSALGNRVLASKRFMANVRSAPNPLGGVQAANTATRKILDQLVRFAAANAG